MGNFGPGGPLPYTEFSFNQKLIKAFRINRKLQTGKKFFFRVGAKLRGPKLPIPVLDESQQIFFLMLEMYVFMKVHISSGVSKSLIETVCNFQCKCHSRCV